MAHDSPPSRHDTTPRVTRAAAAARLSADNDTNPSEIVTAASSPTSRKRKTPHVHSTDLTHRSPSDEARKTKRAKPGDSVPTLASSAEGGRKRGKRAATAVNMSGAGPSSTASRETSPSHMQRDSSARKPSRKTSREGDADSSNPPPHVSRKSKRGSRKDKDVLMRESSEKVQADDDKDGSTQLADNDDTPPPAPPPPPPPPLDEADSMSDPFTNTFLSRFAGHAGLSSSLRALTGLMSGTHNRLRGILERLRMKEDSTTQMVALQELSELLLVSNEDNLAGHFAPDLYVKELVTLMQPNELTGEENPEIMLLACRCIANMMEALPAATASVVYGGAVPILCQKLLEIHFIDLAEQALSTLEKISVEFPSSIVREGGLTACLTYLDFFATSTQRTAVVTAANCCRNIPEDSFPTVRDVMPILLSTLSSNDQRVVEQASLCVCRIVDSFKHHEAKLDELVSTDLLKVILRLLLPGSTNMIGPSIHTQFLRVLSITSRASPRLSIELLKMNVVDTIYQILTGISPPAKLDNLAAEIDKNVIMQAVIRAPREQIFETLSVVCELLPNVARSNLIFVDHLFMSNSSLSESQSSISTRSRTTPNDKKIEMLKECPQEARRFAFILFPTLMHVYTSTVNLSVRQKVLTAQLKMLSNFDAEILESALRGVTFASHLASIFTQQENTSLVTFALQAAELLLTRLESVYRPQFYREGIMAEIGRLADRPMSTDPGSYPDHSSKEKGSDMRKIPTEGHDEVMHDHADDDAGENSNDDMDDADADADDDRHETTEARERPQGAETKTATMQGDAEPAILSRDEQAEGLNLGQDVGDEDDDEHDGDDGDDDDEDDDEDDDDDDDDDDDIDHEEESEPPSTRHSTDAGNTQDIITLRAKQFMEAHGQDEDETMRLAATNIMDDLRQLGTELKACYGKSGTSGGTKLFERLARYFNGGALESITSYELMTSGIVDLLLDVLNNENDQAASAACSDFLSVFMTSSFSTSSDLGPSSAPATPFSVLVLKLQDLLSRAEHFEVITVHQNAFESNRTSAASMLAKQLRLKLTAGEDSGIPRHFRNIMVSIHAIATFKALDDYLRPRISAHERPRGTRTREGITNAMAAYAAAMTGRESLLESLSSGSPDASSTLASRSATLASRSATLAKINADSQQKQVTSGEFDAHAADSNVKTHTKAKKGLSTSKSSSQEAETATASDSELQEPLECPDETRLEDREDEGMNDDEVEAELDALVDDLENENLEPNQGDPSAVNVEVANTGKVIARTDDGDRVSTPSQSQESATSSQRDGHEKSTILRETQSTPSSSSRPMSYANALQQPLDWHIEFSVNGQAITSDTTIYRACHFYQSQGEENSVRGIWSTTHTINFARVPGPPKSEKTAATAIDDIQGNVRKNLPQSLDKHPMTSSILRLMGILHDLNSNVDETLAKDQAIARLNMEPLTRFVNTKLTAKLNRQLEEPLIVASSCLPSWAEDLARLCPFLFPFETRHLFLQSTSFGYARSMSRWQNAPTTNDSRSHHRDERPFLGRLQRQKVRISRSRILESAVKVMELYGGSQSILEVEYFEEVGTGLGPTLEFYSTVSKEFSKKKLKLWRENESVSGDEYAFGRRGLFPAPMTQESTLTESGQRVLHLFTILGKFVARSMMDSRIIDLSFNPTFFRIGENSTGITPSLTAVATVDQDLAKSLEVLRKYSVAKKLIDEDTTLSYRDKTTRLAEIRVKDATIDDLGLDFTLPGYPHIELVPNGSNVDVTIDNVSQYIDMVIDFTLGSGVWKQIEAFRKGFSQVFPYSALKAFTPDELVMLFGRVEEDWTLETLMDSVKADHGYNLDSRSVRNLLQTMSELTPQARRDFLQFVTGSPKLPIGGFKSLTPMFTVVCKPSEPPLTSDDYLPSVMTCVNYLKMPDYSSLEIMKKKLNTAIMEGQGAFHLS